MRCKIKLKPARQILALEVQPLVPIDQRVGFFPVQEGQIRIEPVNPIAAIFVLRGFGEQVMAGHLYSVAGDANAYRASGETKNIRMQIAMLLPAHLAAQRFENRMGGYRHPSSYRFFARHENKLHEQIMVVLIQLLTRKADFHAVNGRQQRVLDETTILALDAGKKGAARHVVRYRGRRFWKKWELDHL